MENLLWGVSLGRLLAGIALIVLGVFSGIFMRWLAQRIWGPMTATDASPWTHQAVVLLPLPLNLLIQVGIWHVAASVLRFPDDIGFWVGGGLVIALVLAVAFLAVRLLMYGSRIANDKMAGLPEDADGKTVPRILMVLRVLVLIAAGVLVVDILGYPLTEDIMDMLDTEVLWGITVLRVLIVTLLLLLGLLSRPFVRWIIRRVLGSQRLAGGASWVKDVQAFLPSPLSTITHTLLWYAAGHFLLLPEEPINVQLWVTTGLAIALVLAVTYLIWRVLDVLSGFAVSKAMLTESRLDDQLIPLVRKTLKIIVVIVVGVSIVEMMGYSTTSLIASLSIGGLAFALAAKDILANVFGSVLIFTDKPFQIGDVVKIGGSEGVIEEVGLRSTRIRALDKSLVTIPNQTFTTTSIVNYSQRPCRRIKFEVGLTYDVTADEMEAFLEAARNWLKQHHGLQADSVIVHFTLFADSNLTVLVQALTKMSDFKGYMVVQEEVLLGLQRLAKSHKLDMAFPTRTLHVVDESRPASPVDESSEEAKA